MVFHITGKTLFQRLHEIMRSLTMPYCESCYFLNGSIFSYIVICSISLSSFQLIRNIFGYRLLVLSYSIYVIPTTPELSIPVFEFHVCILLVYEYTTLSFQIPHKPRHAHFGWYLYQHVYMIWTNLSPYYINFFIFAQTP